MTFFYELWYYNNESDGFVNTNIIIHRINMLMFCIFYFIMYKPYYRECINNYTYIFMSTQSLIDLVFGIMLTSLSIILYNL